MRTASDDSVPGVNMPKFKTVNDILDFAMVREVEAHDFYMRLASLVTNDELRETIRGFAVDELQHRVHLEAIRAGEVAFGHEEVGSLDIAESVVGLDPYPQMNYTELLVVAMKREKAAFRLYTNLASLAENEALRRTLLALAQEEAQHKLRLEIEYDWVSF